jgi:hypothetical protein
MTLQVKKKGIQRFSNSAHNKVYALIANKKLFIKREKERQSRTFSCF